MRKEIGMKTLVIVSHPEILDSASQQFFLHSVKGFDDVTVHHLESAYPDGQINVAEEQALLNSHDRILFQFPFYWYSSPYMLKKWQDEVLLEGFAYGEGRRALYGKEFGLIIMIGINEREYQAGGSERFSINELTKPFQAMAHKTGMTYLRPLAVFQFGYMDDEEKTETLIKYWQLLTMKNDHSLETREEWLINRLQKAMTGNSDAELTQRIRFAIQVIEENRQTIDGLKMVLEDIRRP